MNNAAPMVPKATTESKAPAEPKEVSWKEFLETFPPDIEVEVTDLGVAKYSQGSGRYWDICTPDLTLYCVECEGMRSFENDDEYPGHPAPDRWSNIFLTYRCKNCEREYKLYAVAAKMSQAGSSGSAVKLGELPAFGPHTPARVITLIGPDRELFLKGRRAESRGLGIGAFSYYRRVVENQKSRIIEQIAKVAKKLGVKAEVTAEFEAAAQDTIQQSNRPN